MFCNQEDELEQTTRLVDYLDLAILRELVMDVVLLSLLVDPRHEENPAFDTPLRTRLSHLLSLHSLIFTLIQWEDVRDTISYLSILLNNLSLPHLCLPPCLL